MRQQYEGDRRGREGQKGEGALGLQGGGSQKEIDGVSLLLGKKSFDEGNV